MEKETAITGPITKIKVTMDSDVYYKIMHWVKKAPGEVSGVGKVVAEGGHFRIVDAIMVKQHNTGTSTELDPASLGKAMFELKDAPGTMNFWWHSHVNMGVFWSGTDMDTIRDIGKHGYVLSTVFNKRYERKTSLYVAASGIMPEFFFDDLDFEAQINFPEETIKKWDEDYEKNCFIKPIENMYDWAEKRQAYNTAYKDIWKGHHWRDQRQDQYSMYDHDAVDARNLAEIAESREANDTIIFEELESAADEMENEKNEGIAKRHLTRICKILKRSKSLDVDTKKNLRNEYISRYNLSRPKKTDKELTWKK